MACSMAPQRRYAAGGYDGGDTTLTKIFVGGLAWETRRETMKRYFEQFGEIIEAVVITDKHTGRSKGYGFVTFKDAESARRACVDGMPVIDGRRANCNLASLGHRHPLVQDHASRFVRPMFYPAIASYRPSAYLNQSTTNYAIPYWYSNMYSQEGYPSYGYYNLNGPPQQYPYYTGPGTSTPTLFQNYYTPYNYGIYTQSNQSSGSGGGGGGYGLQYGQVVQYPYLTQQYTGIVPFPTSLVPGLGVNTNPAAPASGPSGSLLPAAGPDQNNSA